MPHHDRVVSAFERRLYRLFPPLEKLFRGLVYGLREFLLVFFMHPRLAPLMERGALRHLERQVPDPELREKLTPNFRMGCKRVLITNDYYPALTQPNTELVDRRDHGDSRLDDRDRRRRRARGRHDRARHGLPRQRLAGRRALPRPQRRADVRCLGATGSEAYWGTTVADFPNLFILVGPNTGLGHNSLVYMIESQINYVLDAIEKMDRHELETVEVRPDVQAAFNDDIQRQLQGHRLELRRLRKLVSRRQRSQHADLARPHLALPAPPEAVRLGQLCDPEAIARTRDYRRLEPFQLG